MSTAIVLDEKAWKGIEPGTEAIIEKWLVGEGDRVDAGQVVANAMLIKASLEVLAPAPGVIERILVSEEQTFARGQPLAVLRQG
jgi:pyruvate/2-oxoglutarate dehydrogenase complex dihydrolipoamide acyltransferase (E2) component